jgi:hypothetical protein
MFMKKLLIYTLAIFMAFAGLQTQAYATERATASEIVFKKDPPPWAPAHGKRAKVRYYYLPDLEMYYDLVTGRFAYWGGSGWLFSASLPSRFGSYNLHKGNIVVMDFTGANPWNNHKSYKVKYPKGYKPGGPAHVVVKGPGGPPVKVMHGHPGHGPGKGKGKGKGKD